MESEPRRFCILQSRCGSLEPITNPIPSLIRGWLFHQNTLGTQLVALKKLRIKCSRVSFWIIRDDGDPHKRWRRGKPVMEKDTGLGRIQALVLHPNPQRRFIFPAADPKACLWGIMLPMLPGAPLRQTLVRIHDPGCHLDGRHQSREHSSMNHTWSQDGGNGACEIHYCRFNADGT